jgi:hypothetical protein
VSTPEGSGQTIQQVWSDFCDDLKVLGASLGRDGTPEDDVTVAEGIRHLSRLVRIGLEANVEALGPLTPGLIQLVDETKKFGCDNPNTIYQNASVDGRHTYRLSGRRGSVDYLSFTTQEVTDGVYTQTGFLDSKALTVGDDATIEIMLSAHKAPGDWLPMSSATSRLSIRQTFLDRGTEQPASLSIERTDGSDVPAALTIPVITDQLKSAVGFAKYCADTFTNWTESYRAHPNTLPPLEQAPFLAAGGDPNIHFYRSYWELAPDQALVVHLPRIPECDTWNLQVDNYWQESMDYRFVRSWLNKHTAVPNPNGSVTAVIAHADPDHPNWLSTSGHQLGHFAMRYVRATEHVDPLTEVCELAKAHDVAAAFASTT